MGRLDLPALEAPICSGMRRTKEGVMRLHVPNMSCGGCARSVTRAIQSVDANASIVIDQNRREVELTSDLPRDRFTSALAAAGFPEAPTAS